MISIRIKGIYWVLLTAVSVVIETYGQSVDSVTRIVILYEKGGSSWDDGPYARGEKFVIKPTRRDKFRLSISEKYVKFRDGEELRINSTKILHLHKAVRFDEIKVLIKEMNTPRENFTSDFIKSNMERFTRREVKQALGRFLEDDSYRGHYFNKDEQDSIMDEIQNCSDFQTYLDWIRPDPKVISVTADAWDVLSITIHYRKREITYYFDFMTPLGQPIESQICESGDECFNRIVNLKPNVLMTEILPKNTASTRIIRLNSVLDGYVRWKITNIVNR